MNDEPIFPYHPDYGLPNDIRGRAVLMSIQYGVKRAATEYNVSLSTIYKWRADMGLIKRRENHAQA